MKTGPFGSGQATDRWLIQLITNQKIPPPLRKDPADLALAFRRIEYGGWFPRSLKISQYIEETKTMIMTRFLQDEQGQDLIEYTLLLAFVCLASAALFISVGGSVGGIWTTANTNLTTANAAAAS